VSGGTLKFTGVGTALPRGLNSNAYTVNDGATMELHRPGGQVRWHANRYKLTLNGHRLNGLGALPSSGGINHIGAGFIEDGKFILASDSTIRVSADSLEIRQGIEGPGGLTKTGSATLIFALDDFFHSSYAYTGDTVIAEGTLSLVDKGHVQSPLST